MSSGFTPSHETPSRTFSTVHTLETRKSNSLNSAPKSALRTKTKASRVRGFTLVEMIVAVGLFAVVMLISVGALMSLVTANRKAQSLQSVINNLNITLDGIVRSVRQGSVYICGGKDTTDPDCTDDPGAESFSFLSANGKTIEYQFNSTNSRIEKREVPGAFVPMTAPEVKINSVAFYVIGAEPATVNGVQTGDFRQPKVMIVIKGTAGSLRESSQTTFHVQATAVQRVLDI